MLINRNNRFRYSGGYADRDIKLRRLQHPALLAPSRSPIAAHPIHTMKKPGDSSHGPDQRDQADKSKPAAAAAALLLPWEACCGGHVVAQQAAPQREGMGGEAKRTALAATEANTRPPADSASMATAAAAALQPAGSVAVEAVPPARVPHPAQDNRLHRPPGQEPPCWVRRVSGLGGQPTGEVPTKCETSMHVCENNESR